MVEPSVSVVVFPGIKTQGPEGCRPFATVSCHTFHILSRV